MSGLIVDYLPLKMDYPPIIFVYTMFPAINLHFSNGLSIATFVYKTSATRRSVKPLIRPWKGWPVASGGDAK
jgi:hypothetical protein